MRVAIYYTPEPEASLAQAAAEWLGRDAWTGRSTAPPATISDHARHDTLTEAPRRYGFHATLKAPFRLAPGRSEPDLREALTCFAASERPVWIENLALARIGSFFVLTPAQPVRELEGFAGRVVEAFDPFRAPPESGELARRRVAGLSPVEERNLRAWDYPYVFESFRFHMTLTGPVPEAARPDVERSLRDHFAASLGRPLLVDTLALLVEPEPGAPFTVKTAWRLAREQQVPR